MPLAYAKVLLSVNGGANQTGGIQVNPADVVHISGENPGYWDHGQFEIYEWPDGWTAPVGWMLQTTTEGSKYVFYSVGGATPPDVTVPTNSGTLWGKWFVRLIVNDGLRNGEEDETLVDESTAFETFSPRLIRGFGAREQKQFDAQRAWAGDLDKNFKRLDTIIAGLGGGGGSTPTGTGIPHVVGGVMNPAASPIDLASGDVTNVLPIAHGGTGLSAVGPANSVLTSTGSALAFVSSLVLAGLTLTSLAGGGTRMLTVDNAGVVGAQAIPSGSISIAGTGVAHVTGGSIDATASLGAPSTVLTTNTGGTDTAWSLISDGNVSGSAAIAGTKISPNFGSQLVQTTGNVRATKLELTTAGPTVSQGTGVPATTEPNGSLFLRTDGTSATTLYVRVGGSWVVPTLSTSYGNDIDAASVAGTQYVVGLTGGTGGTPGEVLVRSGASLAFVGATAHPGTGYIRLPSAGSVITLTVENNAATDYLVQVASSSGDNAFFGGNPLFGHQFTISYLQGASRVDLVVGSTSMVQASSSKITFAASLELVASGPQIQQGSGAPTSTPPNGSLYLRTDGTSTTTAYVRAAGAWTALGTGGGGTPGGSTTQLQYNNAGAFGGMAEFTYAASKLNVSSSGAITFGASPAGTAYLRFTKATEMVRTNTNSGFSMLVLATDASDNLSLGDGTYSTNTKIISATSIASVIGTTTILSVTGTTTTFSGSAFAFGAAVITHGSSPASTGDFRAKSGWLLNLKSGISGDITALTINGSDNLFIGGDSSFAHQAASTTVQAASSGSVNLQVGASSQLVVSSSAVTVQSGFNLIVGTVAPAMNSATNTLFLHDGTQPTAAPSGGVYVGSDSGRLHFRSAFSSAGVPVNIRFEEVCGGFSGTLDPDHGIKITIDKPGTASATRYLRPYV